MLIVSILVVLLHFIVWAVCSAPSHGLSSDHVKFLPGVGELKTRTLAGYALANKHFGGHLFYVFMESLSRPLSNHTILWLNGGPGTSSMFGAFVENGPYIILRNESWATNPYGWNREFNVLWMDNPVGTGFAYVENPKGYVHTLSALTDDLFLALSSFFEAHPEYGHQRLWLFGESFAGHYLAALGARLLRDSLPHHVTLGGLGFGNCWVDGLAQTPTNGVFLANVQRISAEQLQQYNGSMARYLYLMDERLYVQAFQYDTLVFDELCRWGNVTDVFDLRYRHDPTAAPSLALERYFTRADVLEALHVAPGRNFSKGFRAYRALDSDEERSVLFHLPHLLEAVPVLVYSGAMDLICNWEGALQWVQNTIWSGQADFAAAPARELRLANATQPVGWIRSARQLRFVVIENAGHMSPFDQPQTVYEMLASFIFNATRFH